MTLLGKYVPTLPSYLLDNAAIAQVETKAISAPPLPVDSGTPWVVGGSFAIGGAALWAAIAKLLEKYGNSALNTREQKIKQELDQAKAISEFYLNHANNDSKVNSEMLTTFVANYLNTTKQMFDLYYELLERQKKTEAELQESNKLLASIEQSLRDIFNVMALKERQNKKTIE